MTDDGAESDRRRTRWLALGVAMLVVVQNLVVLVLAPMGVGEFDDVWQLGSAHPTTIVIAVGVQVSVALLTVHVVVRQQGMDVSQYGATRRAQQWWAVETLGTFAAVALMGNIVAAVVGVAALPAGLLDARAGIDAALVTVHLALAAGPVLSAAVLLRMVIARRHMARADDEVALARSTRTSVVGRRIHPVHAATRSEVTESTGPGRS